jgi:YrbI family 3-deoxy-D-manno-octulosonate 8-phosphate phosphatase
VYVGNDVNDLGCMELVGCAVAVEDAHPLVRAKADIILHNSGGRGALREICELILAAIAGGRSVNGESEE